MTIKRLVRSKYNVKYEKQQKSALIVAYNLSVEESLHILGLNGSELGNPSKSRLTKPPR